MPLKVLHLSTYAGGGGAARAAANVNVALQRAGVDSQMMTAHGSHFKFARAADRALWRLQRSPVKTWRSPARFGSLSAAAINKSLADVVNLHWVTDGFLSIEEIGKINKPLFMSMYDMWPFCGSEHYGIDTPDARWRVGYTRDNRLVNESGVDMDLYTWQRKKSTWRNFHMIAASSWLANATRTSALCAKWPISLIPHPVDETIFKPMGKETARTHLGLELDRPTVGFVSSAGIGDERKGFDLLSTALPNLIESYPELQILIVGPQPSQYEMPIGLPVKFLGPTANDEALAWAYNAMDVLAVTSRGDNLPLTALEAQMCGRPVVGFSIGGLTDIVQQGRTGYLAEPFSTESLASALHSSFQQVQKDNGLSRYIHGRAIRLWSYAHVAQKYRDLYLAVSTHAF